MLGGSLRPQLRCRDGRLPPPPPAVGGGVPPRRHRGVCAVGRAAASSGLRSHRQPGRSEFCLCHVTDTVTVTAQPLIFFFFFS